MTRPPCAGRTAEFFSELPSDQRRAKLLCQACPRLMQCRIEGANEDHGVWGGLTAEERKS